MTTPTNCPHCGAEYSSIMHGLPCGTLYMGGNRWMQGAKCTVDLLTTELAKLRAQLAEAQWKIDWMAPRLKSACDDFGLSSTGKYLEDMMKGAQE